MSRKKEPLSQNETGHISYPEDNLTTEERSDGVKTSQNDTLGWHTLCIAISMPKENIMKKRLKFFWGMPKSIIWREGKWKILQKLQYEEVEEK